MPVPFILLGLAVLAVWLPPAGLYAIAARWVWQLLLAASIASALLGGSMTWVGAMPILLLWAVSTMYATSSPGRARTVCAWSAALLAVALATHRWPGFSPWVLGEFQVSAGSAPMTLRAHLDKGMAGLLLLACFTRRGSTLHDIGNSVGVGLWVGLSTAGVVVGAVALSGAIRVDPKLPAIALQWMAINLFLTCVLEEALFRGLLQDRLARVLASRPHGAWIALGVASLLFGLVHAGGGPLLIVAAGMAGAGYGAAYMLTGRIEAAIVAHFTLNTVHFLGFTYPYAVS